MDDANWSALHHAVDATTYSERAREATFSLIPMTPAWTLNSGTTGSQPRGFTCLHFACDGSDRTFCKADVVRMLWQRNADLEARTSTGNTPLNLACSTGLTDVVHALVACGADVNAVNYRGVGGYQSAQQSSSTTRQLLDSHDVVQPKSKGPSARQSSGMSESRYIRQLHRWTHLPKPPETPRR